MTITPNIAALHAARDQWNSGQLDGYLRLYSPDAVLHGYPGVEPGFEGVKTFYTGFLQAFPGAQLLLEDVFGDNDKLACRFVVKGVHAGPFQGLAPTGRSVELPGITLLRFSGGLCVERWSQADFLSLLQQLGAVPEG